MPGLRPVLSEIDTEIMNDVPLRVFADDAANSVSINIHGRLASLSDSTVSAVSFQRKPVDTAIATVAAAV